MATPSKGGKSPKKGAGKVSLKGKDGGPKTGAKSPASQKKEIVKNPGGVPSTAAVEEAPVASPALKGAVREITSEGMSMVEDIEKLASTLNGLADKVDKWFDDKAGSEIRKYAAQVRNQGLLTLLTASDERVMKSDPQRVEAYFRLNELLNGELVGLAIIAELAQERGLSEKSSAPELYPMYSFPAPKGFQRDMKYMRSYLGRVTGQPPQDWELIVKSVRFAMAFPEAFAAMPSTIGRSEAHLNRFMSNPPETSLVPPRLPKEPGDEQE